YLRDMTETVKGTKKGNMDLAIPIGGGEAVVFRPLDLEGYCDENRVVCPKCEREVPRKKAREHCRSCKV
ncbi:hypothetical protein BGX20_005538, partial [Mortierella sp. AD010]